MTDKADSPNKKVVLDYLRARETRDLELLDRVVIDDFSHEMLGKRQDRVALRRDRALAIRERPS